MFQRTKICSGLLLAFGGLAALAPSAFAQDEQGVQRVEITGSSIKRVDAETSVPVTVIKAEELKTAGVTTTEQALQQISSVQVSLTSAQAVGAGTGGASYVDMRGLGPNKTLVLLNGRRIANSAFDSSAPDINTIPFAAIDRIEVLRDGASALYGTDAIGGVVNFITKSEYRGGTFTLGLDTPEHPGGTQHTAEVGFGMGDLQKDGLNIFGFVGFQKQAAIGAQDRSFAGHSVTSGTTFPATTFVADPAGNSVKYTPFAAPECPGPSLAPVSDLACGEDTNSFVDYIPASQRISGLMKGSFKLNENHTFSLEAFMAQSRVNVKIAPVPYTGVFVDPSSPYYPGNGITPLPAGVTALGPDQVDAYPPSLWSHSTDANGNPLTGNEGRVGVRFRDLINGYREDDNSTTQGRFTAALTGVIADWDYNVGATLNTTHTQDYLAHGYSNENILAPVDNDPTSSTYGWNIIDPSINPFGPQSAAGGALLRSAQKNGVLQYGDGTVYDLDGHASRDLGDWLKTGRPAAIAVGFEARHERYVNQANTEYAAQVIASTGVDPNTYNAGWRKVYAGFTELNVPVLKSLDLTAAVRYDHYSDFGSTTNPKFSFRFQPSKLILVRGSYSTGFRAPSLYELNAAQTFTNSTSGVSDPVNCPNGVPLHGYNLTDVCSTSDGTNQIQFVNKNGGNPNLSPEKSKNATLGIVLEPVNNLTAEFDYYNIRITKEVGVLDDALAYSAAGYAQFPGNYHYLPATPGHDGFGTLSQNPQQCPNCGYVDELNQNLGSVHTDGVDMAFGYKANAGSMGRFDFDLQSTWVHSYEYQLVPGGDFIQNVGIFSPGTGVPIFRWQHNGNIGWNLEPVSLGFAFHNKSGYVDFDPTRKVSSYWTFDLYGTYNLMKAWTFTAGVKNLFDRDPPYTAYTGLFQKGYDPRFADPTGRTYYGRINYAF
jgi:iron complex outermembrane receptor protein